MRDFESPILSLSSAMLSHCLLKEKLPGAPREQCQITSLSLPHKKSCHFPWGVIVKSIHPKAKLYLQIAPTTDSWNRGGGLWLLVPVGALPLVPGSFLGSKHN